MGTKIEMKLGFQLCLLKVVSLLFYYTLSIGLSRSPSFSYSLLFPDQLLLASELGAWQSWDSLFLFITIWWFSNYDSDYCYCNQISNLFSSATPCLDIGPCSLSCYITIYRFVKPMVTISTVDHGLLVSLGSAVVCQSYQL